MKGHSMFLKKINAAILGGSLFVVSTVAMAVPPAYVTDALTEANATLVEYVGAAAPKVLTAVAILAALSLIVRLVKKAMSGG